MLVHFDPTVQTVTTATYQLRVGRCGVSQCFAIARTRSLPSHSLPDSYWSSVSDWPCECIWAFRRTLVRTFPVLREKELLGGRS